MVNNRMSNVLFVPQNKTHLDNMSYVADKLALDGCKIQFLSLDSLTHQTVFGNDLLRYEVLDVNVEAESPFYLSSIVSRLKLIYEFSRRLNVPDAPDIIVVCNDGALQRAVFARYPKAKTVLMLDGVITDYSISIEDVLSAKKFGVVFEYVRKKLELTWSILQRFIPYKLGCYLPSIIAASKLDVIFVISEYVKSFLYDERSSPAKVLVSGLPRYKQLLDARKEFDLRKLDTGINSKVLFISQGFIWHNEIENNILQHKELAALLEIIERVEYCDVVVRVHPRDNPKNYERYNVEIEELGKPVLDSLAEATVVVGLTSTMLLEADYLGVPVGFLRMTGAAGRLRNTFFESTDFPKIYGDLELMNLMRQGSCGVAKLDYYFSPISDSTVNDISKEIYSLGKSI